MSEIKTNFEFPRGDDTVKFLQRLVQDLSKNFKAIKTTSQVTSNFNSTYGLDGIELAGSFSITGPPASQAIYTSTTQVLNHNFGTVPRGFIVTDTTTSSGGTYPCVVVGISRSSWTTTQISIKIECIDLLGGANVTGTYKILVLR